MKVEVRFDRVYGNPVCYPVNEAANVLASIAGTKTITPRVLELAGALGLEVVDVTPAPAGFSNVVKKGANA